GPAEELDVDRGREDGPLEIGRRIVDAEVAAAVGDRRTQIVVLQPVDVEGAHAHPADRGTGVADPHPAADRPGAEVRAEMAPEAMGNAVIPGRRESALGLPP